MTIEHVGLLLGVLLQVVTVIAGLYYFQKRFPLERTQANTSSQNTESETLLNLAEYDKKRLETQNSLLSLLLERDEQIARLSTKIAELQVLAAEVEMLKGRLKETQEELDRERRWRMQLEERLSSERAYSEEYRLARDSYHEKLQALENRLQNIESITIEKGPQ